MARKIFRPIHQAPTEIDAHAIKGFLEQNGLTAVVRAQRHDFKGGNVSGETLPPRHLMPQDIFVPKEDMHKAQDLVAAYQRYHKKPN